MKKVSYNMNLWRKLSKRWLHKESYLSGEYMKEVSYSVNVVVVVEVVYYLKQKVHYYISFQNT